jgi:legumain
MPSGGYVYKDKLHAAFQTMNQKKMYKEMTVYIEACESGSMFENVLEDNINIYATTAANSHESSWGTYCSPNDKVDGKSIGSCLGDLYSVNWLEDADKGHMTKESLQDQYNIVKKETSKSHVLQWGDLKFTSEPIGNFESGNDAEESKKFWKNLKHLGKNLLKDIVKWDEVSAFDKTTSAVDSRDVKLHYFYNKVQEDPSIENINALQAELTHRTEVDKKMQTLFPAHFEAAKARTTPLPTEMDCLRDIIDQYENHCEKLDDYSLKWVAAMVGECEGLKSAPEKRIETLKRIEDTCATKK